MDTLIRSNIAPSGPETRHKTPMIGNTPRPDFDDLHLLFKMFSRIQALQIHP